MQYGSSKLMMGDEEEFESGEGISSSPDTIVQTTLDPAQFSRRFGPGDSAVTHCFAYRGNREWIFHCTETYETVKASLIDGKILIAVKSDEVISRFLAFADRS